MTLNQVLRRKNGSSVTQPIVLSVVAIMLGIAAISVALLRPQEPAHEVVATSQYVVFPEGVMRVGYGGFPPYTVIDLQKEGGESDQNVTGFSVDLVKEIASRTDPPLEIEWHRLNWDTLRADMMSGKFDFVADPVYQTVARARDFAFTRPYSYFGIAAAVVAKGDERFQEFEDLDQPGVTIALAEGWTSSEYARANLTQPTFKSLPVTGDAFNQLDEVLLGRADVALNDVPTVAQYVAAHPEQVDALWLDDPPSEVPGGFMLKREDRHIREFLDIALLALTADGTLQRLDRNWKTYGHLPQVSSRPGAGLSDLSP